MPGQRDADERDAEVDRRDQLADEQDRSPDRADDPRSEGPGVTVARVQVELLWFAGCPNWQETEARLRQALPLAGVDADIALVEVATGEDAERLRFRGSPTVLLDGLDPFAQESDPVGLSCRVFRTPDGLRGAPTVEQLVAALRGSG